MLKTHIINYAKTREVYAAYRKAGYSKAFLEAHREEIALHKAAKAAFDEAGLQKLPKVKALDAEFAELLTKKKQLTRTTARHGTRCRNWFGHGKTWNDFLRRKNQHRRTSRLDKSRLPGTDREWSVPAIFFC